MSKMTEKKLERSLKKLLRAKNLAFWANNPKIETFGQFYGPTEGPGLALTFKDGGQFDLTITERGPFKRDDQPSFAERRTKAEGNYDRLIFDQAGELSSKHKRNVKTLAAALQRLAKKHKVKISDKRYDAIKREQRSKEYHESDYRGFIADEGVIETVKDVLREIHAKEIMLG